MSYKSRQITCYASAARTATPTAMADQSSYDARGIVVVIDVTAITATPALTVTIQGKDKVSGKYFTILASAVIATVSTTILTVYPGLTAAANVTASNVIPGLWRVIVSHGDADSATYSVGASLIP